MVTLICRQCFSGGLVAFAFATTLSNGTLVRVDDRAVETLVPSPSGQLAACTDDKGRVTLLDTCNLCFLRTWKGYRDAQCAWMQAPQLDAATDATETLWPSTAEQLAMDRGGKAAAAEAASVDADAAPSPRAPVQRYA